MWEEWVDVGRLREAEKGQFSSSSSKDAISQSTGPGLEGHGVKHQASCNLEPHVLSRHASIYEGKLCWRYTFG